MSTRYSKFTRTIYLTGDILLLNACFLIAYYIKFGHIALRSDLLYVTLIVFFNITWVTAAFITKLYDIQRIDDNGKIIVNTIKIILLHALLLAAFIVFRKAHYYSRAQLLMTYAMLTFSILIWRLGTVFFFKYYRIKGYNFRKVIILGCGQTAQNMRNFFRRNPQHGYLFLGFFDDNKTTHREWKGTIEDVLKFSIDNEIDEIYCAMSDVRSAQINELVEFADNNLIRVRILPDFKEIAHKNVKMEFFDDHLVLSFRDIPLDDILSQFTKRTFDIAFSLFSILFLFSWLFPIIAILIKLTSRGPIFFRQMRSGRNNKNFYCWKFRTMFVNEESHILQATKNDTRITPLGKFLRKTNTDELPQFFNVLIGNMSIVGPRPHMLRHTEQYSKLIDKYMVRHFIKPGITGLAQVKGYRGETTHPLMMKNRVKIDIFYIENWSFLLDIKIISMTVSNMFRGEKNAY